MARLRACFGFYRTICCHAALTLTLGHGLGLVLGLPDLAQGALGLTFYMVGLRFLKAEFPATADPSPLLEGWRLWLAKGLIIAGYVALLLAVLTTIKTYELPMFLALEATLVLFPLYLSLLSTLEPEDPLSAGGSFSRLATLPGVFRLKHELLAQTEETFEAKALALLGNLNSDRKPPPVI